MKLFKYPNKLFFLRIRFRNWWSVRTYRLRRNLRKLLGRCERCSAKPAELTSSGTAYVWNGKGRDPNAPILLCSECAKEHIAYWDEMWREYYASQGY